MVEQVTAFKDSSGAVHLDEATAARAEAKLQLEKILGSRADVCVLAVLQHPLAIWRALEDWRDSVGFPMETKDKSVGETGQSFEERYPNTTSTGVDPMLLAVCQDKGHEWISCGDIREEVSECCTRCGTTR